ncbi:DUF1566 domain-containing protein [Photobacterium sp. TY1-4]|uniref:Lcl C-terminal domain-containing protein n=1 Tax=Photobacterium sp. TY1-4 TaxID=2899122 RepID=UPI0021C21B9C|nr:DUF1566 domain-containing protein [Photobacterium sp. TY1-4]UXI01691.1 DUF1566 domain-containing protein [Photobacterium sp. TY1-4]
MRKFQLAMLPVALTVALSGCNSSSSDSATNDASFLNYDVSGEVTSTAVQVPYTVCADINRDWACGSNEPALNAEQYRFTLSSPDIRVTTSPLVVKASLSAVTKSGANAEVLLAAPAAMDNAHTLINGITTLVVGEMLIGSSREIAVATVTANLKALGLALPADIMHDSNQAALAKMDLQILQTLTALAGSDLSYGQVVAGMARGLKLYGQDILDGTLEKSQLEHMQALGKVAYKPLNDTGLTQHLNLAAGGMDTQADPDAPGQDASYGLDVTDGGFKLTKLDATGTPLAEDSTTWDCVKDERTGLIWEVKADDPASYRDKHRLFAYESETLKPHADDLALASCQTDGVGVCTTLEYANKLNTSGYCGKTNWRVPTMNEQFDLLDFGESATDEAGNTYGLPAKYFNDQYIGHPDLAYGYYWSSTLLRTDPGYTSGQAIAHLTQMTVKDGTGLGEITAYYALCAQGQACDSPNALTLRMVAE